MFSGALKVFKGGKNILSSADKRVTRQTKDVLRSSSVTFCYIN